MKRLLHILLILSTFSLASAQSLTYDWVHALHGSAGDEYVQGIYTDASGNVYIAGGFWGTVDFDPSATISFTLTSAGESDAFFAKYTSAGELIWAKRLGSTLTDEIYAISADAAENVYVIGYFQGTVDFDPDGGSSLLTSAGGTDIFFGKFNINGGRVWVNKCGSSTNDFGINITVDGNGDVYVTGAFAGVVDFNPSAASTTRTSAGGWDVFFARYASNGVLAWVSSIGSTGDDLGYALAVHGGHVYVGGYYSGDSDFDPGAGVSTGTNIGGTDGFYARYNQSDGLYTGDAFWATVRSTGNDEVVSFGIDETGGALYLSGIFSATADFYIPSGSSVTRSSAGGTDLFIAKVDIASKTMPWVNGVGGTGDDRTNLIAVDPDGSVYSTGYFNSTVDFDPGPGVLSLASIGYEEPYVAKYLNNGQLEWAASFPGTEYGTGGTLTVDASGSVYVGGGFENTSDFDPGSGVHELVSTGAADAFFGKFQQSSLATAPQSQPTDLVFTNVTASGFDFSFAPASDSPDGYLIVYNPGSAHVGDPIDGVVYVFNDAVGDGYAYESTTADQTFFSQVSADPSTTYHFAIYSYNGDGTSRNYFTTNPLRSSVTTYAGGGDATPPVLVSNTTPTKIAQNTDLLVTVQTQDPESAITDARIYFIVTEDAQSYEDYESGNLVKGSGSTYTFTIPKSKIGELGVSYWFYFKSAAPEAAYYPLEGDYTTALEISGNGLPIPFSSFGSAQTNYRIISIPITASPASVSSILGDDLGETDKSKWRMFGYQNGNASELSASSSLQPKRGYWLIVNSSAQLDTGPGTMPSVSLYAPASITLSQGWNLIGNPYPFDVSWADILDWNDNPSLVSKLRVYKGSFQDGAELEKFSGGFVMASGAVTLEIPTYKNPATGRRGARSFTGQPLDANNWEVDLKIMNGSLHYDLGGIGMNEDASFEIDKFDDFTLPRFFEYVELNHHKKFMDFAFSRDVVSTASEYTWEFSVETNTSDRFVEFSWDNSRFGDNEKQLVLWDVSQQRPVDMRVAGVYRFDKTRSKDFKIFFGSAGFITSQIKVSRPILHDVFPNPATDRVTFAFSVPESSGAEPVILEIFDLMGRRVSTVLNGKMHPGYHEVAWDGVGANGLRPASGVYISYLRIGNSKDQYRVVIK